MGTSVRQARTSGSRFAHRDRPVFKSPLDRAKSHEVVWSQVAAVFDAARLLDECTFVYAVEERDAGPVKIGTAKDPVKRVRGMQTGNPRRLRVAYVLVGDRHIEGLLHEFWEGFAITSDSRSGKPDSPPGTEWFEERVRERLFPILQTAGDYQVQRLSELAPDEEWTMKLAEDAIRDAHHDHDFVPLIKHQTVLMAAGAGTIANRISRI